MTVGWLKMVSMFLAATVKAATLKNKATITNRSNDKFSAVDAL